MASDSRLWFPGHPPVDYGIKVMSVPVCVFAPSYPPNLLYRHTLGIAIAGGGTIAYTVREFLVSALGSLQSNSFDQVSFEELVEVAKAVQLQISNDAAPKISSAGLCTILLAGYCQVTARLRAFLLEAKMNEENDGTAVISVAEVIEQPTEPVWFGSGRAAAMKVMQDGESRPMFVLRKVIHDPREKSVGGGVQYGRFEDYNFKIYGVEDYTLGAFGKVNPRATLRGFELDGRPDSFNLTLGRFVMTHQWIPPFAAEIEQLNNEFNRRLDQGEIDLEEYMRSTDPE